ncbi:dual specificity protein phosphatase CDC14B-like [Aphis craccivora]|uniref:Dual specificity protein phosphatase CDC14B-like n=1 Tax=Aphis craccivora TaxID=307492 RepID=A0A6G0W3R7_APHCR|nr:dual specificity protein phosphatase CDC14B-like [Aphis craccivora]
MEAVNFLQERRVLPSARICPNNHLEKLYFGKKNRNSSNGDQEQHSGRYHDLFRLLACIEHRIIKKSPGFDHYTVNLTYNFVDPTTGAYTQIIERLRGSQNGETKNIGEQLAIMYIHT